MTVLKSDEEIAIMRKAGRIVAVVLEKMKKEVKPGVTTSQLNRVAEKELDKLGAKPSFKGYRGFPAHICASINDEIVHGIPGDRALTEGDIIAIDFGAFIDGFHGDAAITVPVGQVTSEVQRLLDVTEEALSVGVRAARCGARLGDISSNIQEFVETRGYSVIREYSGHGIGRDMHEDPLVPNFGSPGDGPLLKKGMTLALEPMVTTGDWHTRLNENKWTVHTADGSLSAHFEHTIALRDEGPEILTRL